MNIQLVQHGLDLSCLLDVRMPDDEMRGLVDDLKIGAEKKRLILDGVEKGQRSEAIGGVLSALVGAGSDPVLIKYIFDHFPIGDKYREKGAVRGRWLDDEISRAKGFVGSGRTNGGSKAGGQGATPAHVEDCAPVHFDEATPPAIEPGIVPGILKDFPLALSEAIQVPFELALINALGTVAVAAQRKLCVAVKPGYTEPLNIYALCPLLPGERKSNTVKECKAPLVEWQAAKREEMRDIIRDAESERKTIEKAIEAKRTKVAQATTAEARKEIIEEVKAMERELPEVPAAPRLLADDFTPEALAALMERHDEKIGLLEAEGGIFDTLAGKYSNGIPNFDILLKGWGGEPCQIDRKGRDSIFLANPLITMVISPQPEIVQGLASRPGFRGRGLIGRFLFVMPQSRLGGRLIETTPVPAAIADEWRQAIRRLLALSWAIDENGENTSYRIGLDPAAYALWGQFAGMVEAELRPGGQFEFMTDWGGKFPGQAVRLAGLLHVATTPDPHKCAIAPDTMRSALSVAAILAEHAKTAYGLMGTDPAQDCARSILRWLMRDRVTGFTARDALEKVKGRFP
ncbi:YfjI family protein, partial [Solidesulfovibrio sp.]|uniref:YfjI family protein n=1 Tax=Solidesulfovibrio sp. TaxID=2910990 RepID=UPI002B1FCFF6